MGEQYKNMMTRNKAVHCRMHSHSYNTPVALKSINLISMGMKHAIVFSGIIMALHTFTGCASSADDQKLAKEKENIAVVEKYIRAVEAKDTKIMTDLLADNYIGFGPSFTDTIDKAGAVENWKLVSEKLYEKIDYQRTVNIAATITDGPYPGDYVSDWANLKITYKDGRGPVNLSINAVYRIEDGKITLSRSFYNEADVLRQLGYEFNPSETK